MAETHSERHDLRWKSGNNGISIAGRPPPAVARGRKQLLRCKIKGAGQPWEKKNLFEVSSCFLIKNTVCSACNTKRFSHLYIELELFFKKLLRKTFFLLVNHGYIDLEDRAKLYLSSLFLAVVTGPSHLFPLVCLFCSVALVPILSCVCSPWLVLSATRCGTRNQRGTFEEGRFCYILLASHTHSLNLFTFT